METLEQSAARYGIQRGMKEDEDEETLEQSAARFGIKKAPPADPHNLSRYSGTPDVPLEDVTSPIDLGLGLWTGALSAKIGAGLAPKAGGFLRSLATAGGLEAGYKVQQATGMSPGAVTDVGLPDALNVGVPVGLQTLNWLRNGGARLSRAGQSIAKADRATAVQDAAHDAAVEESIAQGEEFQQFASGRYRRLRDVPPDAAIPPEPVHVPSAGRVLTEVVTGGNLAGILGGSLKSAALGAIGGSLDIGEAALSRWLMASPGRVEWLRGQMTAQGLSPKAIGVLTALGREGTSR